MGLFHAYIYRCAYSTRIYIGTLATRPHLGDVSSLGGDASSRRHCQVGGRCHNLAIRNVLYLLVKASSLDKQMPTRGRVAPRWGRTACWWGRVPYARVHNIYLETFFVPCFIFITQCIDNQHFQEMKHWHSMFHFWFQCFSGVSPIGVWFLSHWGFKSLPLCF